MYKYTGTLLVPRARTATVLDNEVSQSTDQPHGIVCHRHYTVTGAVGERLQANTEDAPVLDRPAPLRRFTWFGYKYPDLVTYLQETSKQWHLLIIFGTEIPYSIQWMG